MDVMLPGLLRNKYLKEFLGGYAYAALGTVRIWDL